MSYTELERKKRTREAFRAMEDDQWKEYQEYMRRCGGIPISKIPASQPLRSNIQEERKSILDDDTFETNGNSFGDS